MANFNLETQGDRVTISAEGNLNELAEALTYVMMTNPEIMELVSLAHEAANALIDTEINS